MNKFSGIAAWNVNGVTIHRLFQLRPQRDTGLLRYSQLAREFVKKMMNQFENVKLIICDEVSMVSNILLYFIHLRLEEIYAAEKGNSGRLTEMDIIDRASGLKYALRNSFGGRNILLTGDLMQLQPVNARHCFKPLNSADVNQAGGGLPLNVNLFDQFNYFELEQNMRQGEDLKWSEALERFRIGNVTEEDVHMLHSRLIMNFSKLLPGSES